MTQQRHESPELGAAAARMVRALVVRAADGDTEALEQLAALEQLVPAAVMVAGHAMHGYGYSHSELAAVLGISRQASVKRFGPAPMDTKPLGVGIGSGWPRLWAERQLTTGEVMRWLVQRLAGRRG